MIKCPACQHENLEGTIVCEECGFNLLDAHNPEDQTKMLDELGGEAGVMSGWGTTDFEDRRRLIVYVGDAPEPLFIEVGSNFTLGRYDPTSHNVPDFDLTPYDALEKGVSRMHAALQRREGNLVVIDLGSANGTRLNGKKLDRNAPYTLRDGDNLRLGELVLHIYFG